VTWPNGQTGIDLFLGDNSRLEQTLVFKMGSDPKFLNPLKAFINRRMYANIVNDFLVPLGTAAVMTKDEEGAIIEESLKNVASCGDPSFVKLIKVDPNPEINHATTTDLSSKAHSAHGTEKTYQRCVNKKDLVATTSSRSSHDYHTEERESVNDINRLEQIVHHINALGWEKHLVYFPDILPFAHNRICALESNRLLKRIFAVELMRSCQGQFVMDHIAEWIKGSNMGTSTTATSTNTLINSASTSEKEENITDDTSTCVIF